MAIAAADPTIVLAERIATHKKRGHGIRSYFPMCALALIALATLYFIPADYQLAKGAAGITGASLILLLSQSMRVARKREQIFREVLAGDEIIRVYFDGESLFEIKIPGNPTRMTLKEAERHLNIQHCGRPRSVMVDRRFADEWEPAAVLGRICPECWMGLSYNANKLVVVIYERQSFSEVTLAVITPQSKIVQI